MTIYGKIRDEKLQYDINKQAAKMSALSSGKINQCEYLTSKEILPSEQSEIIERAKFTYSPLGKALEKQTKTIEDVAKKQTNTIEGIIEKQILNTYQKSIGDFSLLFSAIFRCRT